MISDEELDRMDSRKMLLSSKLNAVDIRWVDKMWTERKMLIHELRRMNALMDQILRCSAAGVGVELYAPRPKRN